MSVTGHDSLKTRRTLDVDGKLYDYFSLDAAAQAAGLGDISRLPFSLKVLLENLVRLENGRTVTVDDIKAVGAWLADKSSDREIAFRPARVLMQDLTGVPAVVDLAAMRAGDGRSRRRPEQDQPAVAGRSGHRPFGADRQFRQRRRPSPPTSRTSSSATASATAFCAGARTRSRISASCRRAPASAIRSISNTCRRSCGRPRRTAARSPIPTRWSAPTATRRWSTGLSVLGWGVGGIEAEAAMLGQPISMLIPEVVGFRLVGKLREGATATDLVLTITQMLRRRGVVGRFVEYCGPGIAELALADRATIGNMAPEYGATCGFFPIDAETIRYLTLTARDPARVKLVEAYAKAQGLWRDANTPDPAFTDMLELDLVDGRAVAGRAAPAAGPRGAVRRRGGVRQRIAAARRRGREAARGHGSRARITNCTTATS